MQYVAMGVVGLRVITRKEVAATILHKVDTLEVYIPDSLYTRMMV